MIELVQSVEEGSVEHRRKLETVSPEWDPHIVIRKRIVEISAKPQEHAHKDQAQLELCSTVGGQLRTALVAAHWQHVT
jgi:hypothetical protein